MMPPSITSSSCINIMTPFIPISYDGIRDKLPKTSFSDYFLDCINFNRHNKVIHKSMFASGKPTKKYKCRLCIEYSLFFSFTVLILGCI